MKNEKGSAFLLAIFLLTVLTMLAVGVVATATTDLKISDNYARSMRNLYVADAGASHAVALLAQNPSYGNLAPYPSGTPLTTGAVGGSTYSIWAWNQRITGTGAITNFPDPRSRQIRVTAVDPNGRGNRKLEGVIVANTNYPLALDQAVFSCGDVRMDNANDDAVTGPIYAAGNVTWRGDSLGSGSSKIQCAGSYTGYSDVMGSVWANGGIASSGDIEGGCRAGGGIGNVNKCAIEALQNVSPVPVKTYCNSASSGFNQKVFMLPSHLTQIYNATPTGNRLTTGWSVTSNPALSDSYYYVTGGNLTLTGVNVTYTGHSVIVVDGGNFVCNNCSIGNGATNASDIMIVTKNGDINFTGNANVNAADLVLWAGVLDGSNALPANGSINVASTASVDIDGEVVAMRGVTSNNRLRVRVASAKPTIFSDGTYQISEWREVR